MGRVVPVVLSPTSRARPTAPSRSAACAPSASAPDEPFCKFIQHFSQVRNKIPRAYDPKVIAPFSTGVTDVTMREKLAVHDELDTVVELFDHANKSAKAGEGRLFAYNDPHVDLDVAKPKGRDSERKGSAVLAAEPEWKRGCDRDEAKDDCPFCVYHNMHSHATEDCHELKLLCDERQEKRGGRNDRGPRRSGHRGYQEHGTVAFILGGAQAPPSNRHFKQFSREVNAGLPEPADAKPLKWLQYGITFDHTDHPKSTKSVGTIPLLCTPIINNVAVTKTLIHGSAGLNVISVETSEQLHVPYKRLMPTRPFSGITDGSTMPLGQVRLAVTFSSRKNYHTELIDCNVAHIGLPYNTILGYPALAKFMAVTHHAYNTVKMLGCSGIIAICCDEKDAMRTLEHAC
ncbi:uncharacterized protein [Aegilops tauschii subsp. strangulata]|uniref:uncharacterized protein n=1 Tax=Aegilops tauschii subsp. strangulata TaxID=200361 RepID=UPI003CC858CF